MTSWRRELARLVIGFGILVAFSLVCRAWSFSDPTIVALSFLLVVLVVAAEAARWTAVTISVVAMLVFNFAFFPPVGTFTIADPQNWIVLFTFLAVSLAASHLSAVARTQTTEALSRRNELARLFDVSRDVLVTTDSREALPILARLVARRFDLEFVAIALPRSRPEGDGPPAAIDWDVFEAGPAHVALDTGALSATFAAAQHVLQFDAVTRTYEGQRAVVVGERTIRLVPLRAGTDPIGLLAVSGRPIEPGSLDALGGVVALAIERARFLEERKAGELTRQSEALKAALLASIGHDLRTPLTAIRVAAANLQAPELTGTDRLEQTDVILSEVARLTRLFQNILEMARIDAGAVPSESRWVHPSEIVEAARDQVEQALRGHLVTVTIGQDVPVQLDPRLTASALAHVLENAAQYTPIGSEVTVSATVTDEGLVLQVRDRGPGVSDVDLPHLFDRFYRGHAAGARTSGTGMGLWIVRGLLAVAHGRVWVENAPGGGAVFTIVVPATQRHEGTDV
jgi:two-component system sensor histidine kinase KdpD